MPLGTDVSSPVDVLLPSLKEIIAMGPSEHKSDRGQGAVASPSHRVSPGSTLFLVICKQSRLGCISRLYCKQPLTKLRAGEIGGKCRGLPHPVQKTMQERAEWNQMAL